MPKIVLIRGLPGSGKSTMAKQMLGFVHLEADMQFEIDGEYVYDPAKVRDAHSWCLAQAKASLKLGKNVVVSNTFCKTWELQRYVALGYPFEIIEATGNWQNIHGVSENVIEKMRARWESLDIVNNSLRKANDSGDRTPSA